MSYTCCNDTGNRVYSKYSVEKIYDVDMETDIRLEKNTYNAGETAKGTLLIKADKNLKVRKLKFSVCGKEGYEVNYGSWTYNWKEKNDIFFVEDLSPFLNSIYSFPHNDDSNQDSTM